MNAERRNRRTSHTHTRITHSAEAINVIRRTDFQFQLFTVHL